MLVAHKTQQTEIPFSTPIETLAPATGTNTHPHFSIFIGMREMCIRASAENMEMHLYTIFIDKHGKNLKQNWWKQQQ